MEAHSRRAVVCPSPASQASYHTCSTGWQMLMFRKRSVGHQVPPVWLTAPTRQAPQHVFPLEKLWAWLHTLPYGQAFLQTETLTQKGALVMPGARTDHADYSQEISLWAHAYLEIMFCLFSVQWRPKDHSQHALRFRDHQWQWFIL